MTASLALRRTGAAAGIELSRITLGTMRLSSAGDAGAAADILAYARDIGITSFHCSSEYETFPLFQEAWRLAGPAPGTSIISKVATPHFGEDRFSATVLRAKVEAYLWSLGLERLDVVQWLLRHDLKRDEARLRILEESAHEVAQTIAELRQEGKIGAFVGFPYTAPIAAGLIGQDHCDGLALYVNPLEHEMDSWVEACGEVGKFVIAIRPFAAGRLFTETDLGFRDALDHVFGFDAVATAVVSASSVGHLDQLGAYLRPAA